MKNVTIVVLHYENIKDTKECLDSIELLQTNDVNLSIIVVDNFSTHDKINEINKIYKNIIWLRTQENLGFAKGNNLGIIFAKYNLNPDYVIVINNDVIFNNPLFLEILISNCADDDIVGPKILSLDKKYNQNPIYDLYLSISKTKKRLFRFKILRILLFFRLDEFFQKLYVKSKNNKQTDLNSDYKLHGACIIFTKRYLERFDGFNKSTFLYFEEDFLKYRAKQNNLIMRYEERLEVIHKEASTTNLLYNKSTKKRRFIYNNSIESLKLLIKTMEGKNEDQ